MAFQPENGAAPRNPSVSYAPGAGSAARAQPTRSGAGGSSSAPTNRAASVQRRAQKNAETKPRDQASAQPLIEQAASFGLKRPYIPWNAYPTATEAAPADTTASATFVSLVTVAAEPQHPQVRVRVIIVNTSTAQSEVRLLDRATGTVLAGPVSTGAGLSQEAALTGTLINPTLTGAGAPMKVDVQARVTAGAGNVAVTVVYALGLGT